MNNEESNRRKSYRGSIIHDTEQVSEPLRIPSHSEGHPGPSADAFSTRSDMYILYDHDHVHVHTDIPDRFHHQLSSHLHDPPHCERSEPFLSQDSSRPQDTRTKGQDCHTCLPTAAQIAKFFHLFLH